MKPKVLSVETILSASIHAHRHACTRVHARAHTHSWAHAHSCVYMCMHTHALTHSAAQNTHSTAQNRHAHTHTHTHTCVHKDMHIHTHTCVHTHTHTCARTHRSTCTHKHSDDTKLNLHSIKQAANRDSRWIKTATWNSMREPGKGGGGGASRGGGWEDRLFVVVSIDHLLIIVFEWVSRDWLVCVLCCVYISRLLGDNGRLQYLRLFVKMCVNAVFLTSCLYSTASLTLVREQRFIRMIYY